MNKDEFIGKLQMVYVGDKNASADIIKEYDCSDEKELEKEINDLIINLEQEDKEIRDIKYSTSCCYDDDNQIYIFSALVMYDDKIIQKYEPKRYEIVEKIGSEDK